MIDLKKCDEITWSVYLVNKICWSNLQSG